MASTETVAYTSPYNPYNLVVPTFSDEEASRDLYYAEFLENNDLWKPYVKAVCEKHSLTLHTIKACLKPGTFPVLIVDKLYAVKLYTRYRNFLDGDAYYRRELKAYGVLCDASPELAKKVPIIVAHGTLVDNRTPENQEAGYIHYMVTTFLEGIPVSDIFDKMSREEMKKFARDLGEVMKEVHELVPDRSHFSIDRWEQFILGRREQCIDDLKNKWKSLPDHLIEQIDDYLPKDLSGFINSSTADGFLHCDISKEHILMNRVGENEEWRITGFLDWGDARYGDVHYELSVIHTDSWACDKDLLREFINGYNTKNPESSLNYAIASADFAYRSMVYLLLFEFNCFQNLDSGTGVFSIHPEWKECKDLAELARNLWDLQM